MKARVASDKRETERTDVCVLHETKRAQRKQRFCKMSRSAPEELEADGPIRGTKLRDIRVKAYTQ